MQYTASAVYRQYRIYPVQCIASVEGEQHLGQVSAVKASNGSPTTMLALESHLLPSSETHVLAHIKRLLKGIINIDANSLTFVAFKKGFLNPWRKYFCLLKTLTK